MCLHLTERLTIPLNLRGKPANRTHPVQYPFHSLEPGSFRTAIASPTNRVEKLSSHPDYAPTVKTLHANLAVNDGNQPGDPKKGAEIMIDVVKGKGAAKGKEMPPRLPMGSDALEVVRKKCLETLKTCDEWEEAIKSTDFPVDVPAYRSSGDDTVSSKVRL